VNGKVHWGYPSKYRPGGERKKGFQGESTLQKEAMRKTKTNLSRYQVLMGVEINGQQTSEEKTLGQLVELLSNNRKGAGGTMKGEEEGGDCPRLLSEVASRQTSTVGEYSISPECKGMSLPNLVA